MVHTHHHTTPNQPEHPQQPPLNHDTKSSRPKPSTMKLLYILPALLTTASSLPSLSGWSLTFNDQIFHDNGSSVCFCAFIANSTVVHIDGITNLYVVKFARDAMCRDIVYSWNADGVAPAVQDTHSFQVLRVWNDPGMV
ncbi:uncharacterized protein LDX57_005579 [Aspergillus melleus]|uniref:uncharacterized protein n=1 Tax=Aspergillus melleus TaxID=138277 RepID=UPI001E8E2311|nr:uncharacterized protein LDX57_005579 [Aspergillus melleus]KAH8427874.1 hypothetical protein LDX57_005579 [Aspergillus melleus]